MADKDRQELDRLLSANQLREDDLHDRGACTDRIVAGLRADAFIDSVVEALGIEVAFQVRVEQRRAQAYVEINAQLDAQEEAQRRQALLGGAVPFPVQGVGK